MVDAEHFLEVWLMNEEEAKGLIRKALDADQVINMQQLGLPWEEPDNWFLHNVGPITQHKKKKSATELAEEVMSMECKQWFPPGSSLGWGQGSYLLKAKRSHVVQASACLLKSKFH